MTAKHNLAHRMGRWSARHPSVGRGEGYALRGSAA
jgi:hypothetical protein